MNNAEAQAKAQEWHGQAGGRLCPQLTENELAGLVNEAIGSTLPVNLRDVHTHLLQLKEQIDAVQFFASSEGQTNCLKTFTETAALLNICLFSTGFAMRWSVTPIRPGDVMRLKPDDDACSGPCKKYFLETLFLCVGFDGEWIKARSHFGTQKLGPVMFWKTDGDNFDVIGHVALPAAGAPT